VNSRSLVVTAGLVGLGLLAWFFFAWLALDRNIFDALGESVGSGLLLLLIVSIGAMLLKRD
jgi:hypothetical protein